MRSQVRWAMIWWPDFFQALHLVWMDSNLDCNSHSRSNHQKLA